MAKKKQETTEQPKEIKPLESRLGFAIKILEEKICREYGIELDYLRSKTIQITNNQLTII